MEKDIAKLQRRLKRSKLAVFIIIGFLIFITYLLIIIDKQSSQTQNTSSQAQTIQQPIQRNIKVNPNNPGASEMMTPGCTTPTLEGCGQKCFRGEHQPIGIAYDGVIECPTGQGLTCEPSRGINDPNIGRCINTNCEECETCNCDTSIFSSCPNKGTGEGAYIFSEADYKGKCSYYPIGAYEDGKFNDAVYRLVDPPGESLAIKTIGKISTHLWTIRDFFGTSCFAWQNIPDMKKTECGDSIKSLIVREALLKPCPQGECGSGDRLYLYTGENYSGEKFYTEINDYTMYFLEDLNLYYEPIGDKNVKSAAIYPEGRYQVSFYTSPMYQDPNWLCAQTTGLIDFPSSAPECMDGENSDVSSLSVTEL